jgi:hypothetical protein
LVICCIKSCQPQITRFNSKEQFHHKRRHYPNNFLSTNAGYLCFYLVFVSPRDNDKDPARVQADNTLRIILIQAGYLGFTHKKTVCIQPHVVVKGVQDRVMEKHSRIQSNHVHVASACFFATFMRFVRVLEVDATPRLENCFSSVHIRVVCEHACVGMWVCMCAFA